MLANLLPTPPERGEALSRSPSGAEAARTPEGARFAELLRGQRPTAPASAAPAPAAGTAEPAAGAKPADASADERPVPGKARLLPGARREAAGAHPAPEADPALAELDPAAIPPGQGVPSDRVERVESEGHTQEEVRAPAADPAGAAFVASPPAAARAAADAPGEAPPVVTEAPRLPSTRRARGLAAAEAAGAQAPSAAPAGPAGDGAGPAVTSAPPAAAPTVEALRGATPAREPGAPLAPPAAPELARAPALAAAPAVTLPTSLAAPNFGETLAAQVSIFARDGLQHAELRLNPPEMGPIGVQIEVTGSDARIHFHAAQAATREVIERALPELAGALRGEGLTLAGGGVFDRPADTHDGGFDQGREGTRTQRERVDAPAQAHAVRSAHVPQGRLDVFA